MKNMSEYNKFLKMFNKAHSDNEDASLSEREDIIPVRNAAPEAQQEEKTAEEKPAEADSPEENPLASAGNRNLFPDPDCGA